MDSGGAEGAGGVLAAENVGFVVEDCEGVVGAGEGGMTGGTGVVSCWLSNLDGG